VVFQPFTREQYIFFRLYKEVEINVEGIVNYIDFFIINKGLDKILLEMPFTIKA
jgi:hypothetical protein